MTKRRESLEVLHRAGLVMLRVAGVMVLWAAIAFPVTAAVFLHSSRTTTIAGHDATVTPTLDGYATFDLGPFVPSFRYPADHRVGVHLDVGKTVVDDYPELMQRYGAIAGQPDGQIAKIRDTLTEMALDACVTGAVIGLAGPCLWALIGRRRRRELFRAPSLRTAGVLMLVLAAAGAATARPWDASRDLVVDAAWQPIYEAVPGVPIPEQLRALQVDRGLLTSGVRRLVGSSLSSYDTSRDFYHQAAERVPATVGPQLHQPAEGESVALFVSDRHDNIGMDQVARALGDAGNSTILINAGDDTSTGSPWEAFSLESLDATFDDYEHRYTVAGNHDEGDFVNHQAADLGFTVMLGQAEEGPDGIRLLGDADPRSSGLGNWRDSRATGFAEQRTALATEACDLDEAGERVSVLLTHDANVGDEALERGCVDLVLGGHVHNIHGPTLVAGENGESGYSYTNGTTGGAAYAIAIGSKPKHEASVSLVTFSAGRPVGVQWVKFNASGEFEVGPYTALLYPQLAND